MFSKNEILNLFQKEDSICRVLSENYFEVRKMKQRIEGYGFFLELDIKNIPLNKCLITNNHILKEDNIKIGKLIKIEYKNKEKIIDITENRRVFTSQELDYTLIEILDKDKISSFFKINPDFLNEPENFIGKEIFILCLYKGLSFSTGEILKIKDNIIIHDCSTGRGCWGSPIIDRYNLSILGIHFATSHQNHNEKFSTSISSIINDIKDKFYIITTFNYKDKYKDLEIIGSGNYGTVYKAKIKDKDNYIAIKVINKDDMKNRLRSEYNKNNVEYEFYLYIKKSIKNEIENMKICMEDNINSVKFYELYDTEKEFAIVMELCDDNLQNILNKKNEGFNKDEIYKILTQLNNTFKIMSKNYIIHRDIKLENILIKYEDKKKSKFTIKLTDYGVSRKLISLSKKCKTYEGTLITMSPEIMAGEEHDNETDLWSLGVIIYQLFFKKYPYNGLTEVAIYNQINKFGQTILDKTGDEKLDDLIRKLLVKNPKDRIKWEGYFNHPFFKK